MFILGQIFGGAAFIAEAATFQFKTRRQILLAQIFANLFWTASYFGLDAFTGMALAGVSLVRVIVFYLLRKKSQSIKNTTLDIIIVATIFASIFSWQDWRSILPLIGSLTMTLALYQEKPQYSRRLGVVQAIFWLFYNLIVLSIFGIVTEIISLVSTLIAIQRFAKKRERTRKNITASDILDRGVCHDRRL